MSLDRLPQRGKSRCGRGQFLPQPSADITYIPVQRGFLYLVAIMDWATRRVHTWTLSTTLDAGFCVEALDCYGRTQIFNTDHGSPFTNFEFSAVLKNACVAISMDGRNRCTDNMFIERLWRSLKYEAVYLREFPDGFAAQKAIAKWLNFYHITRPHSALAGATPADACEKGMLPEMQTKPPTLPAPLPAQPEQREVLNRTLAA